jgi:hypothetical protein
VNRPSGFGSHHGAGQHRPTAEWMSANRFLLPAAPEVQRNRRTRTEHTTGAERDPARVALTPKHRASHKKSKTCACNRGGVHVCPSFLVRTKRPIRTSGRPNRNAR